jgi:Sugar phosphate isomerases/epimerases
MTGSVALQLYTVRDETAKDFAQTLQHVAEIGYTGVEFAGYGNIPAPTMAKLLQNNALKAVSTHVSYEQLVNNFEEAIEYCLSIDCPYLIVPWIDKEWLNKGTNLQGFTEGLNDLGYRAKRQGLTLGYHNHNFEFETIIHGKPLYDQLVAKTDPALVKFELDTYWAAYAHIEVVPLIQQLCQRQRLITLHLKDMTHERTFTEVGAGILPIDEYIQAAQAKQTTGAITFIVENDRPTIPSLESARRSLENLRKNTLLYPR